MAALENQVAQNRRSSALLEKTRKEYPFINNTVGGLSYGTSDEYQSETWKPKDQGTAETPRPKEAPMDLGWIQLFNQNAGTSDVAGEAMHLDPRAQAVQQTLMKMLSPQQWEVLKHGARDYQDSLPQGEESARRNAMDSAIRGYVMNQWPDAANAEMQYTPEQLQQLDSLKQYTRRGY